MKTSNKYIVLAAMALTFAACTQEDDFTPQTDSDAVKINATIGKLQTRVAYEDDGATNFINRDEICVQNILRETKNIATYTFDGTTWTTTDALVWNGGTAESQFQAWYPATASFDKFTLPTDQNSIEELPAADWMTASTSAMVKPADKTINLAFEHKLAKITVQITEFTSQFGDDPGLMAATIYSLSDEYVTVNGGIKPVLGGNAATAIVCPGKYTAGTYLMGVTISDDGHQTNLNVPVNAFLTDTGLEAGKHYKFSLKVGKDAISITKVNVEPWTTKEIDGDVAEEYFRPTMEVNGSTVMITVPENTLPEWVTEAVENAVSEDVTTIVVNGSTDDACYDAIINARSGTAVYFEDLTTDNYVSAAGKTYTCTVGSVSEDKYVLIANGEGLKKLGGDDVLRSYTEYVQQLSKQDPGARLILPTEAAFETFKKMIEAISRDEAPNREYYKLLFGNALEVTWEFKTWKYIVVFGNGRTTLPYYYFPVFDVPLN